MLDILYISANSTKAGPPNLHFLHGQASGTFDRAGVKLAWVQLFVAENKAKTT